MGPTGPTGPTGPAGLDVTISYVANLPVGTDDISVIVAKINELLDALCECGLMEGPPVER